MRKGDWTNLAMLSAAGAVLYMLMVAALALCGVL